MSHIQALTTALSSYGKRPVHGICVLIALTIVLAIPLSLHILIGKAGALLSDAGQGLQVSIYLKQDALPQALQNQIAQTSGVRDVVFIDKNAALAEFEQGAGISDALEALDANPLPAALHVSLDPTYQRPAQIEALIQGWLKHPEVSDAKYDLSWVIRLQNLLDQGRDLWWLLTVWLALACMLIVYQGAAACAANLSQTDLPRHLRSHDKASLACLYYGLVTGLLAALLAIAVSVVSISQLHQASAIGTPPSWAYIGAGEGALVLCLSAVLAAIAALLAARH